MRANLSPDALEDLLDACHELIDANERRNPEHETLTLAECQAVAVLHIRLDDLSEMERAA